jgi:hypothetical protein
MEILAGFLIALAIGVTASVLDRLAKMWRSSRWTWRRRPSALVTRESLVMPTLE